MRTARSPTQPNFKLITILYGYSKKLATYGSIAVMLLTGCASSDNFDRIPMPSETPFTNEFPSLTTSEIDLYPNIPEPYYSRLDKLLFLTQDGISLNAMYNPVTGGLNLNLDRNSEYYLDKSINVDDLVSFFQGYYGEHVKIGIYDNNTTVVLGTYIITEDRKRLRNFLMFIFDENGSLDLIHAFHKFDGSQQGYRVPNVPGDRT